MKINRRLVMAGICVVMAGSMILPSLMHGAEPTTAPAGQGRDLMAIGQELKAAEGELRDVLPNTPDVADPAYRKADGAKAVVALKKVVGLMGELAGQLKDADDIQELAASRYKLQATLVALQDEETIKGLEMTAGGKNAEQALRAKSTLALGKWWANSKDAAAQGKLLEEYTAVAKANPASDDVALTLMFMGNVGAATPALEKQTTEVVKSTLTGGLAKSLQTQLAAMERQQQEHEVLMKGQAEMIGKPIDVSGRTSKDGKFSIAELKGKVVLVDFWATWCGPCVAELPDVKAVYKKYHDKGFEIVGVSCDGDEDALNTFIAENEMPWVQLHDKTAQAGEDTWHALAHKFGVTNSGIPTMYLVDKKGILRDVEAGEDLEGKVGKLLDEK